MATMTSKTPPPIMSTLAHIPGREVSTILGIVTATATGTFRGVKLDAALADLTKDAARLGADAVVGIQVATCVNPKAPTWSSLSEVLTTVIGTAVRLA